MTRVVAPALVAVGLLGLLGCGPEPGRPAPGGSPGRPVTATTVAGPEKSRERGSLPAKDWPDACVLSASVPGVALGDARPVAGRAPGTGQKVRARQCVSTVDGTGRLTLTVLAVTDDVLDDWSSYRFSAGAFRNVSHLGDEAFLTSDGVRDEVLYVCRGRTIFTVAADVPGPQAEMHRVLLAVAGRAVAGLAGSAAGTRPAT